MCCLKIPEALLNFIGSTFLILLSYNSIDSLNFLFYLDRVKNFKKIKSVNWQIDFIYLISGKIFIMLSWLKFDT